MPLILNIETATDICSICIAKGSCYALDKPMIAINTLESLAYAAKKQEPEADLYIPMIDARRMEVYAEIYDQKFNRVVETQNIIFDEQTFSEYFKKGKTLVFCGNGAPKTKALFESKSVIFNDTLCAASHLVPLSLKSFQDQSFVDIAYYSPVYFKAPNITVSRKTL